jgi:hypothetical protein
MTSFRKSSRNVRTVEHDAFYQGAHGQQAKPGLAEIDARFNHERAEAQKAVVERMKALEASIEYLQKLAPEAERRWAEVQQRWTGCSPYLIAPVLYLIFGAMAMLAEAFMLAPSLDLLNIAQPVEQRIVAFVIGVVAALFFHFAWETYQPNDFPRARVLFARLAGLGAVIALVFLGILRGQQSAFAATMSDNPLGQFLHDHSLLGSAFFVFLTLGCPLAAAFVLTSSLKDLGEWQVYRSAKSDAHAIPSNLIQSEKQLEMENEKLKHQLQALDDKRQEWNNAYLVFHQRGASIGAKQSPYWLVWLKAITAGILVACPAALLLAWSRFAVLLPVAAAVLTYLHFRHVRIHPTPEQYFALQNTQFRALPEAEGTTELFETRRATDPASTHARGIPPGPQSGELT